MFCLVHISYCYLFLQIPAAREHTSGLTDLFAYPTRAVSALAFTFHRNDIGTNIRLCVFQRIMDIMS